jgi:hypothetical protein
MTLTNESYLVVEDGAGNEAVFQFQSTQSLTSTLSKNYLVGGRGQYIAEAQRYIQGNDFSVSGDTLDRRAGKWIDAGAGDWEVELEYETGINDTSITWGDAPGDDGQANVTRTDASGADVKPISRMQVLQYWIAQTRSDSFARSRIHIGEYTDGRFGEDGVYGYPIPVAVQDSQVTKPEDQASSFNGTLTMQRVTPMPILQGQIADWVGTTPLSTDEPDYLPEA